jgi:hypothetical protein
LITADIALFAGSPPIRETGIPGTALLPQEEQPRRSERQPSSHPISNGRTSGNGKILMKRVNQPPKLANNILAVAFTENAYHPNPALRALLYEVRRSSFVLYNQCEPLIADYDSLCMLAKIVDLPGCPSFPLASMQCSLFTVFVGRSEYRCLFCGSCKTSLARALGCVRSHLGHRPFHCIGCDLCNIVNG